MDSSHLTLCIGTYCLVIDDFVSAGSSFPIRCSVDDDDDEGSMEYEYYITDICCGGGYLAYYILRLQAK